MFALKPLIIFSYEDLHLSSLGKSDCSDFKYKLYPFLAML